MGVQHQPLRNVNVSRWTDWSIRNGLEWDENNGLVHFLMYINGIKCFPCEISIFSFLLQSEVRVHVELHNDLVIIQSFVSRSLQWFKPFFFSFLYFFLSNPSAGKTFTLLFMLQPQTRITCQVEDSPNLLCIVDFNLRSLLDKFGVLLHKFNPPLCMLLQVVKLIL